MGLEPAALKLIFYQSIQSETFDIFTCAFFFLIYKKMCLTGNLKKFFLEIFKRYALHLSGFLLIDIKILNCN